MAPLAVQVKHAGKTLDVSLDPDQPPAVFKDAIYHVTGVPPDRMKVMIKGGVLKDDTVWKKVAPKEGQTFMVIGAAGDLPKPPEKPIVFLEDMDDSELAEALAKPVGLKNLGNTCYMNATLQSLRAIPELQTALSAPHATNASPTPLPKALSALYTHMSRTTDAVTPVAFLQILRTVVPQFGEVDRSKGGFGGYGYAQQDAEECWGKITDALKDIPLDSGSQTSSKKFIEAYMMGHMRRELKCDEAPDEPTTISTQNVLKIECNISSTTNYMHTGIIGALDQKIEKNSPTLGRDAVYSEKSRLARLPSYLTVHMMRFMWRSDIRKKAKIMRKVKFPTEFDALDLVTDELKGKMLPVSRRLKELEKERAERRKVRKRTKNVAATTTAATFSATTDVEMADASAGAGAGSSTAVAATTTATSTPATDEGKGKEKEKAGGELEDESVYRKKELEELEALISPELRDDIGCSVTGLYELIAIVTHKGAAADAGHYIGFVKKSVFRIPASAPTTDGAPAPPVATPIVEEDDEDWYKFDDDRVSDFPVEKLATLDGGGEDSSAYVLLYKSKSLA